MWLIVITGLAFMLITLMFIELIKEKDASLSAGEWVFLILSPIFGVFITRLIIYLLLKQSSAEDVSVINN